MDIASDIGKYKSFIYYDGRLASFDTWSSQIIPDKYQLAKAGFFYSGFGDKVVCFSCDLKLFSWNKTDEPWIEHYKNSPDCLFLKTVGYRTDNTLPIDITPMDITPNISSSQFVFRSPQPFSKDTNPLFSIFSKESK